MMNKLGTSPIERVDCATSAGVVQSTGFALEGASDLQQDRGDLWTGEVPLGVCGVHRQCLQGLHDPRHREPRLNAGVIQKGCKERVIHREHVRDLFLVIVVVVIQVDCLQHHKRQVVRGPPRIL